MPANVDAMVQEGIAAFKAGRKADAKKVLTKAVEIDERNEEAWLWLSGVVDSADERQICLENVLAINPNNVKAQKGLEATLKQTGGKPTPPPAAPASGSMSSDPFAGSPFEDTGFDSNPYGTSSNDLGGWSDADFDRPAASAAVVPASSVEWGPPPSSGSQSFAVAQTSPEEYDNWMAGLSIGGSSTGSSVPVFEGGDFDTGGGPFDAGNYGDDLRPNLTVDTAFEDSYQIDPSTADVYGGSTTSPADDPGSFPFEEPKTRESDPFGLKKGGKSAAPPAATPAKSASSSGSAFNFAKQAAALTSAQDNAPIAFDENTYGFDGSDSSDPLADIGAMPTSSNMAVFTTIDSVPNMPSPSYHFRAIPDDIRVEKVSLVLIASLVILAVLNIGSVLVLLGNLH